MKKSWNKNQDNSFTSIVNNNEIGKMSFAFNHVNKTALFNIGKKHFSIKQESFWNNTLFVADISENEILKMYTEKLYANNWVVEYGGNHYKLSVRNNPLAEYLITDGEKVILAYGLQPNDGKVQVKITGGNKSDDFICDFLLWYLFAPVAVENTGDNLSFSLLFTQN